MVDAGAALVLDRGEQAALDDAIRAKVGEGSYAYAMAEVEFVPGKYFEDPEGTSAALMELAT